MLSTHIKKNINLQTKRQTFKNQIGKHLECERYCPEDIKVSFFDQLLMEEIQIGK